MVYVVDKGGTHYMEQSTKALRIVSIIINIVMLIITLATMLILNEMRLPRWSVLVVIFLQVVSISLGFFHQKSVDKEVFDNQKEKLFQEADPDKHKNTIQGAREELRRGLEILMTCSIIACLIWIISTREFLLPTASICILCIGYLYADYVPHTSSYAKNYDMIFVNDWKSATKNRGLARIYLEEYEKTRFKKRNPLYKEFSVYTYNENSMQQEQCIKNILRMGLDTVDNYGLIFSIVLTALNIFFIEPNAVSYIVSDFIKNININPNMINALMQMTIIIVFSSINLLSFKKYESECERARALIELITKGSTEERFNEYKRHYERNKAIRSRGIFVSCATYMDKKNPDQSLDTIDLQYRMLFTHRLDANLSRFWTTVFLSGIALLCFLLDFAVPLTTIGFLYAVLLITVIIFRLFILERLGKKRIVKYCKELLIQKQMEESKKSANGEPVCRQAMINILKEKV